MNRIVKGDDGSLQRLCKTCGAVVESTLGTAFNTKPTEYIACPECGADNSVRPSLAFRLRYGRPRIHRHVVAYGRWWWLRIRFWQVWMLDREINRPAPAQARTTEPV